MHRPASSLRDGEAGHVGADLGDEVLDGAASYELVTVVLPDSTEISSILRAKLSKAAAIAVGLSMGSLAIA